MAGCSRNIRLPRIYGMKLSTNTWTGLTDSHTPKAHAHSHTCECVCGQSKTNDCARIKKFFLRLLGPAASLKVFVSSSSSWVSESEGEREAPRPVFLISSFSEIKPKTRRILFVFVFPPFSCCFPTSFFFLVFL